MTLDRALLAEAAMYGITVTASETDEQDQDPGITYAVRGPGEQTTMHQGEQAALLDMRGRITAVEDARRAALERAQQWGTEGRDLSAYREIMQAVNDALPAGCTISLPPNHALYSVASLPPLTVTIANALSHWQAQQREQSAHHHLREAVEAEGAELRPAEGYTRPLHVPYWESRVELWRPLLLAGAVDEKTIIRRGRVRVAEGTVREVAWNHYGVVLPVGMDSVDASANQIDRARSTLQKAMDSHQTAARRLSDRLGV